MAYQLLKTILSSSYPIYLFIHSFINKGLLFKKTQEGFRWCCEDIVSPKFQKRSALKFVGRTIPGAQRRGIVRLSDSESKVSEA
jgi:hypothetical protein